MQEHTVALPARTAFLRHAERHDVAAGMGLAKLAMWYANEGVPFDESVEFLAERAAQDATAVRAAYEYLAFTQLSHSTHTQVMALFVVNELRGRIERADAPKGVLATRIERIVDRLKRYS